jgi:hypothetical protein
MKKLWVDNPLSRIQSFHGLSNLLSLVPAALCFLKTS